MSASTATPARWQLPDRVGWLTGLGVAIGLLGSSVGPWIVGGLVDSGRFSIETASLMVTIEQIIMGVVMLVLAGTLHRIPRRPLILAGVILALGAQVSSFLLDGFGPMAWSRAFSGIGFALIYSASTALGATTPDPDRTFALAQGMTQLTAMAMNPLLGFGADLPGHKGVFAVIGLSCAVLCIPYLALAMRYRAATPAARSNSAPLPLGSPTVLGVLAVMTVYSIATGGAWNFMERVAASVGLGGARLGSGLMLSSLIGTLGSVLANRLGSSYGRYWPLCSGLLVLAAATLWLLTVGSQSQFWIVISLWAFVFTFTTPFVFGLAATADPSGRDVAATGTAFIIVSALGVYFGAFVVTRSNLTVFGWVALALLAGTAALAAIVIRWVARGTHQSWIAPSA